MADLGMYLVTLFGGVIGSVIGFVVIGLVAALLALPYMMLNRKADRPEVENPRYARRY